MILASSKNSLKLASPAKINLCLDILSCEPSGYHKIQTVFYETAQVQDFVELQESKQNNTLSIVQGGAKHLVKNPAHPVQKALAVTKKLLKTEQNISVTIEQNIPFSSGLGGSSSNAAAVIKGLNKLWNLGLSQNELLSLAEQVGMDVPFFIIGGMALGTNYGEKITALPLLQGLEFTLHPQGTDSKTKTADAFAQLNLNNCGQNTSKTEALIQAIKDNNPAEVLANLHNDFAPADLKIGHHLSGSGPSTFTASLV